MQHAVQIVMSALREPTDFAEQRPDPVIEAALVGGASLGIAVYGGAVHATEGVLAMVAGAARALFAAGASFTLSIPALIVLGALLGSALPWRRAVLSSLVAVNFGGLAFMASIPVVMLLELSSPIPWTRHVINVLVVAGVGSCSTLVFERAMARLEGHRQLHRLFMGVFGVLFVEIAWLVDMFRFTS